MPEKPIIDANNPSKINQFIGLKVEISKGFKFDNVPVPELYQDYKNRSNHQGFWQNYLVNLVVRSRKLKVDRLAYIVSNSTHWSNAGWYKGSKNYGI